MRVAAGRVVTVVDRGFSSDENLAYLRRAGGHFIAGERMRDGSPDAAAALARAGRYQQVRDNLRVKEVTLEGTPGIRWVVCHNPDEAVRTKAARDDAVARGGRRARPDRRRPRQDQGSQDRGEERRRNQDHHDRAAQARRRGGRPRQGRMRVARPPGAGAVASPAPDRSPGAGPDQGRCRGTPRRQVPALHLRPTPVRRRHRAGLQEPARGRTRLPGPQVHPRSCDRCSTASGPHPRPRPVVLARAATHPGRRNVAPG